MLSILGWVFIGLFAGSIAQAFIPSQKPGRIAGTVLLGICAAVFGGLMAGSPFRAGHGEVGFVTSLGLAVLGSTVLLGVHLVLSKFVGWLGIWDFWPKLSESEKLGTEEI